MVMRDSDIFLDDLRIPDVEAALGIKIRTSSRDGFEFLDALMGVEW